MRASKVTTCIKCGRNSKYHARGLCDSCYTTERRNQRLEAYSLINQQAASYCLCTKPVIQRLPVFNAVQCRNCGRPFERTGDI